MTETRIDPTPVPTVISELVGVYDADAGIVGEARYVVGHVLGRVECALCDITHNLAWRKKSFDALRVRLGVPFEVVHRNQRSPEVLAVTGDALPIVVGRTTGGWVVLLEREQLADFGGDVDELDRGLRAAVSTRGLTLAGA